MQLKSGALIVIQHDVETAKVGEYLRWHSFEHLPERLSAPGFLHAERWELLVGSGPKYFCVIDVESLSSLESPEYVASLNAPSEWTQALMPHYQNVQRMLCETLADFGAGVAPFQLYVQFDISSIELEGLVALLASTMTNSREAHPIVRIRLGSVHNVLTSRASEESRIRGADGYGNFKYLMCLSLLTSDRSSSVISNICEAIKAAASGYQETLFKFSFALDSQAAGT